MVSRQMVCGLRMYLGRGAGRLGRNGAIGTWDRRERFFENGELVFTRDGRVDRRTIESKLPAKEMTCTTFGTNVGDANRPSTTRVLIPSAG
jgi:hypothetical protein